MHLRLIIHLMRNLKIIGFINLETDVVVFAQYEEEQMDCEKIKSLTERPMGASFPSPLFLYLFITYTYKIDGLTYTYTYT